MTRDVRYGSPIGTSQPAAGRRITAPRSRPGHRPPARRPLAGTRPCRRACRRRRSAAIASSGRLRRLPAHSAAPAIRIAARARPIPTSIAIASRPSGRLPDVDALGARSTGSARRPAGHTPGTRADSSGSAWSGNTRAGSAGRSIQPSRKPSVGSDLAAQPRRPRWRPAGGPTRDRRPGSRRPGNSPGNPPCASMSDASRCTICLPTANRRNSPCEAIVDRDEPGARQDQQADQSPSPVEPFSRRDGPAPPPGEQRPRPRSRPARSGPWSGWPG